MDIHAPESPIHSFKDFAIHIAVVTVGIMIALGLEGVRESVLVHRLVKETRANFRAEMSTSLTNMNDECKRVTAGHQRLDALAVKAPLLGKDHPEQVLAELDAIQNPYYFFSTNSWQAALSSGVLAHMATDETSLYAWSAEGTRIYVGLQSTALAAEQKARAFWRAHPHPTPDQVEEGTELILLFAAGEQLLADVAPQTQSGFVHAQEAARR